MFEKKNMEHKPFYFIGNILDPKITAPLLIKQGYEIKKANPSQIKIIRTKLDNIREISQNTLSYANPYESDIISVENEKYYQIEKIENENDLKYWILEIDCNIDDYDKNITTLIKNYQIIDKAFLLSELNIQLLWGLFAILEYVLTTNESGKSINKQLQTKLNLLNNRFPNKISISDFFKISDGFKFEKIIEKLYAYRSDIAHRNPIDFENKLQILNNILLVENFLLTLVRRTIRQVLFEPDLIIDLKKC